MVELIGKNCDWRRCFAIYSLFCFVGFSEKSNKWLKKLKLLVKNDICISKLWNKQIILKVFQLKI